MNSTTLAIPAAPERRGVARARALLARHAHFIRYVAIGGGAFLIDVGLYTALALGAGVDPFLANTVSVGTSVVASYLGNAFANFRVRDRLWLRFLAFVTVCAIGYLVSMALLWVFIALFDLDPVVAKLLTLPVVLVVQFVLNKRVTFGSALSASPERTTP